jgi:uncharacterized protein (TIGR02001 family)
MNMKTKFGSALFGVLLVSGAVTAQAAEVSGNVALVSDYRFRGISQNAGELSPAIQGGFDVAFENGIYAGTWASNVNFSEGGAIEMDFYAGWAGTITEGLDLDVSYLYYAYPKDGAGVDLDYWELAASLGFMGATVGVNYADDYFAETGEFWYLYGDYSIPLGDTFSLDLHVGYNSFDEESFLFQEDKYLDYSVGVSTSYFDLDWSLAYVGLDIGSKECFGAKDICDDTVVLSVSKSL